MKIYLYLFLVYVPLLTLASCNFKYTPESLENQKDFDVLDSTLISVYEQTHEDIPGRINRLDSLADECGKKNQFFLQMQSYSIICSEYQFQKNIPALDSFSRKAAEVVTLTQDSSVLATYHFILGKNLYSTSRSPDSALSHLLKAVAFSRESDSRTYLNSVLILGLIAQESGDYTTALDFFDLAIDEKKKAGKDSLLLAHYYVLGAMLASSKTDTSATHDYYNSAKLIIDKAGFDKVRYQSFVEARLAFFDKRYDDALKSYNATNEFNLLVYTDKIRLFEQTGQQDSLAKTLKILESFEKKIYDDKDVLKEYLPLKIKYSNLNERSRYVDEYTGLMKNMLVENKAVTIQKNLQEIERIRVEKDNQERIARQEKYTTMAIFSAIFLGMIGLISFLVIASKRRRLEYALLNSKHETSKLERNRIAQELHDDLGANLTTILMASELMKVKDSQGQSKELDMILNNTKRIYTKLKEIVWSLNTQNDTLGNLILYIRRFTETFLEPTQIKWQINDSTQNQQSFFVDAFTRRRIYLALKEIINNTVKHANATGVILSFDMKQDYLHIMVSDNGTGFDMGKMHEGNGVENFKKMLRDVQSGPIDVKSGPTGTQYDFAVKLENL